MRITTVPFNYLLGLFDIADRNHIPRSLILDQKQAQSLMKTDELKAVSVQTFTSAAKRLMIEMNDESCGLLPHPIKLGTFSLLCQSCTDCQNLGHFLRRRKNILRLISDDISMEINQTNEITHCAIRTNAKPHISWHFIVFLLSTIYRVSCWGVRARIPLQSVHLTGPDCEKSLNYSILFDCPISYNSNENSISFPTENLARPILQRADDIKSFLNSPAYYLLAADDLDVNTQYAIKQLLNRSDPHQMPSLQDAATLLNISAPTLRRRLALEGTTYRKLIDITRRDIAFFYLARGAHLQEVANQAGFAESTSFYRAFKRWTGTTPKQYDLE